MIASRERYFFTLRYLKTDLRNVTGENCLNDVVVINIYQDLVISKKEIINELTIKTHYIKLI